METKQSGHKAVYKYDKGKLKKAWLEMVNGTSIADSPEKEILDSWEVCRQLQVNPHQKVITKVLSGYELEQMRKQNEQLIRIGRPSMENIFDFVSNDGFIVALSDKNGILLEVFGDPRSISDVQAGHWIPGADCSEASAGNNIVGTAIRLQEPVKIIGYEHYCRCSHHYGGAGAPIFDTENRLVGTISISGKIEDINQHTLGIVIAVSSAIETHLAMFEAWKERDLAYQLRNILIENIDEGIIFVNAQHRISYVNEKAGRILNAQENQLLNYPLEHFVEPSYVKRLRDSFEGVVDDELLFMIGKRHVRCIITSKNIEDQGQFNGMVIMLRDFTRTTQLTKKMNFRGALFTFDQVSGVDAKFRYTVKEAKVAAKTDSTILLLGESGTGKDVFAQSIHNESGRRNGPYVAINCGAIPKELIASELFGYADGAFSGAKKGGNKGKFEMADGGTIFLDEIGEMPMEQQIALLRVLEEKAIVKVGTSAVIPVDVRIIAATNKNLLEEVEKNRFRQDLYYRLNVFTLQLPPLRDRKSDIVDFTEKYLKSIAAQNNMPFKMPDMAAMDAMLAYSWPGNIRELQNVLERASILAEGAPIGLEYLNIPAGRQKEFPQENQELQRAGKEGDFKKSSQHQKGLEEYEAQMIQQVIRDSWGNISQACKELGMSRTTLYRKMSKYNIKVDRSNRLV